MQYNNKKPVKITDVKIPKEMLPFINHVQIMRQNIELFPQTPQEKSNVLMMAGALWMAASQGAAVNGFEDDAKGKPLVGKAKIDKFAEEMSKSLIDKTPLSGVFLSDQNNKLVCYTGSGHNAAADAQFIATMYNILPVLIGMAIEAQA